MGRKMTGPAPLIRSVPPEIGCWQSTRRLPLPQTASTARSNAEFTPAPDRRSVFATLANSFYGREPTCRSILVWALGERVRIVVW